MARVACRLPEEEELNTLRRLGFARNTRMACCARLKSGPVDDGPQARARRTATEEPKEFDRSIASVVVIGNGIAGVTAADFTRRGHPDCEIHLVGAESHVLYNRMGISRLVYGRSAMQGLFLLAEQWYDEHNITAWLNTVATRIDLPTKQVFLGTGDVLSYDRLVLAMGSSSTVPPIDGFGWPGSFVMRDAGDAIAIRAYVQQNGCRQAVVAGGGLLGLEAAYSLYELGLEVTVLERGVPAVCPARSTSAAASWSTGTSTGSGCGAVRRRNRSPGANGALQSAVLKDGRELPCQVFLGAIGIRPNVGTGQGGRYRGRTGGVVDDRMETSVPGVFAAGDVAEHSGMVLGLWPIAAKQGEVAAVNALGGDETAQVRRPGLHPERAPASSCPRSARSSPGPDDELVVIDNPARQSYRRMVISDGRLVGGVVLGHHPEDFSAILAAVKKGTYMGEASLAALRGGDCSVLKGSRARFGGRHMSASADQLVAR